MSNNKLHITLATLIVPTLIVAIAPRLAAIPGPSTASATPNPQAEQSDPTATPPAPKLTAAQHAAIAHRQAILNTTPTNPFHYPIPQNASDSPYQDQPPDQQAPIPPTTIAPPTLLITSMASAQGKGIAIINGKLHNEGDTIAEGWTITSINPIERSVTIRHTNGTTHTASQTR